MSCSEYDKYGLLYQSKELSKDENNSYEQHLEKCSFCRNQIESERNLFAIVSENRISPPEYLHQNILDQVKKESRLFGFLSKRLAYTLTLAAATALLLFVNTKLINETDTQADWQAESGIVALTEVASIEDEIALMDMDYWQSNNTTTNETDDESTDLFQTDETLSLIDALNDFE